ncbi:MAG: putative dual-specificity RNA methyltransferase RlmN [Rhodothermaceae bacterium]|nr:MAG: putative dual-specificity RNA methyltransferase RlmN [Rhodothermaceae bacterium]
MERAPLPTTTQRLDLRSLRRDELEDLAERLGQPRFRGRQLFKWLYGKGATSFDEMTDLPAAFRTELAGLATLTSLHPLTTQTATDGTVKTLFELSSGRRIETVLIPDFDDDGSARRLTVCVSSQVGCAMGCTFCATGLMGFQQNLTAGEIFEQVWRMDREARRRFGRGITNIVYMGMGEPLLNYDNVLRSVDLITDPDGLGLSPKRITVSTVGLARRIRQLADDDTRFNLAVSLHAPTDAKRSAIMPVNRRAATDLGALREAIQYYTRKTGRRVTYEYCMFAGVNDTDEDARALARIVAWAPSKVNLIMYNPVEGLGFARTSEERLHRFIRVLVEKGVTVTVRRSRGQDIDAACGQLAVREA